MSDRVLIACQSSEDSFSVARATCDSQGATVLAAVWRP